MTTAERVVLEARKEIGYTENPAGSNRTKFAAEAGHANGHYWCATFTTAILKRCGVTIPSGAGTASTRSNLAAWKRARRWVEPTVLQPGDVVFFHISGRNGNDHNVPDHTGIVVQAPKNGRVTTVEGNTSSGESGSQDNGGGVYTRTRPMSVVIGAGRPNYAATPPPPTPEEEEDDMDYIVEVTDDNSPIYYWVSPTQVTTIGNEAELGALSDDFKIKRVTSFEWDMIRRSRTLNPR